MAIIASFLEDKLELANSIYVGITGDSSYGVEDMIHHVKKDPMTTFKNDTKFAKFIADILTGSNCSIELSDIKTLCHNINAQHICVWSIRNESEEESVKRFYFGDAYYDLSKEGDEAQEAYEEAYENYIIALGNFCDTMGSNDYEWITENGYNPQKMLKSINDSANRGYLFYEEDGTYVCLGHLPSYKPLER